VVSGYIESGFAVTQAAVVHLYIRGFFLNAFEDFDPGKYGRIVVAIAA